MPRKTFPRTKDMQALASCLAEATSRLCAPSQRLRVALALNWPQIVGAELAALSRPVHLRRHGKMDAYGLTLEVLPGYSLIVQHEQQVILARVSGFLSGFPTTRLIVRTAPQPWTPQEESGAPQEPGAPQAALSARGALPAPSVRADVDTTDVPAGVPIGVPTGDAHSQEQGQSQERMRAHTAHLPPGPLTEALIRLSCSLARAAPDTRLLAPQRTAKDNNVAEDNVAKDKVK